MTCNALIKARKQTGKGSDAGSDAGSESDTKEKRKRFGLARDVMSLISFGRTGSDREGKKEKGKGKRRDVVI